MFTTSAKKYLVYHYLTMAM